MANASAFFALLLSLLSFGIWGLTVWKEIRIRSHAVETSAKVTAVADKVASQPGNNNLVASDPGVLGGLADAMKAITALIEAISKAGPALAGLVAAIAFLALSIWSGVNSRESPPAVCTIPKDTPILLTEGKSSTSIQVVCTPPKAS